MLPKEMTKTSDKTGTTIMYQKENLKYAIAKIAERLSPTQFSTLKELTDIKCRIDTATKEELASIQQRVMQLSSGY